MARPKRGDRLIWGGSSHWTVTGYRMYKSNHQDFKWMIKATGGHYIHFVSKDVSDDPRWQYEEDDFTRWVKEVRAK